MTFRRMHHATTHPACYTVPKVNCMGKNHASIARTAPATAVRTVVVLDYWYTGHRSPVRGGDHAVLLIALYTAVPSVKRTSYTGIVFSKFRV